MAWIITKITYVSKILETLKNGPVKRDEKKKVAYL